MLFGKELIGFWCDGVGVEIRWFGGELCGVRSEFGRVGEDGGDEIGPFLDLEDGGSAIVILGGGLSKLCDC